MKRKSITICALIISIIFVVAIACFFYSLAREYSGGGERTGRLFDNLVASTKSVLADYGTDSVEFRDAFDRALGDRRNYEFITLKAGDRMLFAYPDASAAASGASRFCVEHTSSFSTGDGVYIITASMYALRPEAIFYYARFAFLIILAATAAAVVLIIYLSMAAKNVENDTDSDGEIGGFDILDDMDFLNEDEPAQDLDGQDDSEIGDGAFENIYDIGGTDGGDSDEIEAIESADGIDEIDNGKITDFNFDETNASSNVGDINGGNSIRDIDNFDDVDIEGINSFANLDDNGFDSKYDENAPARQGEVPPQPDGESEPNHSTQTFSDITGMGFERDLETKLDEELKLAENSERDISLFLIRVPFVSLAASAAMGICDYLLERFERKDMVFEYGADGFAAIKEGCDVDGALETADALYGGISKLLKDADSVAGCAIGISSRSVRTLPAERLLMEAAEALENAVADETKPIVAFRADAEKYKRIMENEA